MHYLEVDVQSSDKDVLAPTPEASQSIVEIDALDCKGKWYQAFIVEGSTEHSASVRIHFMGWDSKWDETIPRSKFSSHIRPRSSCEIGPKGHGSLENVRTTYPNGFAPSSAASSGVIVVGTCEETLSMNAQVTSSKNVWHSEPCVLLIVKNSNLKIRVGPSLETSVVGCLLTGKKFWFSKIVGSWAKLSSLHYNDLSNPVHSYVKDFKPHNPEREGWCLMKSAQGEVHLADATLFPDAVPASSSATSSSFGLFASGAPSGNRHLSPPSPFGAGNSFSFSSGPSNSSAGFGLPSAALPSAAFTAPPSPFSFAAPSSSSSPFQLSPPLSGSSSAGFGLPSAALPSAAFTAPPSPFSFEIGRAHV